MGFLLNVGLAGRIAGNVQQTHTEKGTTQPWKVLSLGLALKSCLRLLDCQSSLVQQKTTTPTTVGIFPEPPQHSTTFHMCPLRWIVFIASMLVIFAILMWPDSEKDDVDNAAAEIDPKRPRIECSWDFVVSLFTGRFLYHWWYQHVPTEVDE